MDSTGVGNCAFLVIFDISFTYLLEMISPSLLCDVYFEHLPNLFKATFSWIPRMPKVDTRAATVTMQPIPVGEAVGLGRWIHRAFLPAMSRVNDGYIMGI